ncbi:DUF4181 domain-containing protein [Paenibacillus bovis]|uniref:DUF4181 domain-containing protein n=1 Tax=Paenibacillus bovis TaxID=1616788 RepID=A0A172ZDI4_9BACL|nr:DUF4181 domain-containing protein [Paenibacillus bovis]ANF95724.1 hypothetical protein AR543_06730 [Paenibacillus bovis]
MLILINMVVIILIPYLVKFISRKYLHIEKQDIMQSPGRRAMIFGNVIFIAVIIIILFIPGMPPIYENFELYVGMAIGLIILTSAYQIILENKYFPGSKQYIITLGTVIIGLLYLWGLMTFY